MVRIGGLASGMDTDSLVKDLMKAERMPLDKYKQKKQALEWKRDDYRSMNSLLLSLRDLSFDMKLSSNYRARSVSSSNDSKITATATSAANLSSFTVSKIDRLATAATKVNTGSISKDTTAKVDSTKGLYSIKDSFGDSTFNWSKGSVETTTISATESGSTFNLTLSNGVSVKNEIADLSSISVKVNGTSFKVVAKDATPQKGEVKLAADGTLTFGESINKGSSIKVDYVADKKVDTFKSSDPLKELQLTKGALVEGSVTITAGSKTYVSTTNGEIKDETDAVVGSIDFPTGKITFNEGQEIPSDTEVKVAYEQHYFSFGITTFNAKGSVEEKFNVQGTESLNNVLSRINGSQAGVTAFYDSFTDQVTLTRKETGNFNTEGEVEADPDKGILEVRKDEIMTSGTFLNNVLKFDGASETGGENAKFTINGLETQRTSNTFEMNGVTLTLKDKTEATDPPISLGVSNNTEAVFENIKKFVDKYNETIEKIQAKLSEDVYRSYTALTDEQREQLSDKQQEQWEEKAKSGLLRRDPILSSVLSQMRLDFYTPVKNSQNAQSPFQQLTAIGIKTSSNYLEGGKLTINEAELKKAIEEDPASVEQLFAGSGTAYGEKGIVNRLYDSLQKSMGQIRDRAGSSLSTNMQFAIGRDLNNVDKQISSFESRLTQIEDRYWRQFTAMEKAIQRSNEQAMFMMQQFGG
ncbi:flagellar filament capping protein FliD [Metabacillus iocasae]|uniref:Flagellar hook-associated protein 2 n=1 Tax=Priestia iocasae TaxID=2291674 RepID=A0ABS2R154_9BACI|nr:flagellar filament capping protein FliD [Metabacillus iocasae]MBM7704479.1 flagellar hook-associated protein 2 [Metabacillus iocasae]